MAAEAEVVGTLVGSLGNPTVGPAPIGSGTLGGGRGRGRPSKSKTICRTPDCGQPELCTGLCRRCYHQTYNTTKKTNPPTHNSDGFREKSAKRQRRRSISKGPFTTAEGQLIDTPYIVEIAKDARAKCQRCKERIHREELRIGTLRAKVPGACRWHHPQCLDPGPDFSVRRLYGRKKLEHADRAALKHLLSGPKKHKHRHRDSSSLSSSSSRSHRKSSEVSSHKDKSRKEKSSSSHKHKKHRSSSSHKDKVHPPAPVFHDDSSDSSSYSDVDDYEDEEPEESYSDGSSDGSSDSDDYFHRP